jgi:hypothetical protein
MVIRSLACKLSYRCFCITVFSFVDVVPGDPFIRSDIAGDGPRCTRIRVVIMKEVPYGCVVRVDHKEYHLAFLAMETSG